MFFLSAVKHKGAWTAQEKPCELAILNVKCQLLLYVLLPALGDWRNPSLLESDGSPSAPLWVRMGGKFHANL